MEVSSHALALHRVDGTRFAAAVFTNLGHDHLDLHGTVEEYFRAKARLFTPELSAVGVTNVDDPHGRLLLDAAPIEMVPYSLADATDARGHRRPPRLRRGAARGSSVPLGGAFNVINSLAAATTAAALGVEIATPSPPGWPRADAGARPLRAWCGVPGRHDDIVGRSSTTPTRPTGWRRCSPPPGRSPPGDVIVVFGCGGDRDHREAAADGRRRRAGSPTASS